MTAPRSNRYKMQKRRHPHPHPITPHPTPSVSTSLLMIFDDIDIHTMLQNIPFNIRFESLSINDQVVLKIWTNIMEITKNNNFHSRKWIWKWCLQNGGQSKSGAVIFPLQLTHLPQGCRICASANRVSIGSHYGLAPNRRSVIFNWTPRNRLQ